jgi:lipopolysaccharide/colanic/teichoic acid biosynthesis glycosyltransferase
MTGWWQVNGRSDKPMHMHTEDDLFYVQNYSLWLDLKILLRTIVVVLRGQGAY